MDSFSYLELTNQALLSMLPSLKNKEWLGLVMGTSKPPITSHSLKIKLNSLQQKVRRKLITAEEASRLLYEDCKQNEDLYRKDLHEIFKKEKNQLL